MLSAKKYSKLRKNNLSIDTLSALISERIYQERLWNSETTASGGNHSNMEFLVFIDDYLKETFTMVSRNPEPQASDMAVNNIRKIAALVLAAAEKNRWITFLFDELTNRKEITKKSNVVESLAIMRGHTNKAFDVCISTYPDMSLKISLTKIFATACFSLTNNKAINRDLLKNEKEVLDSMVNQL